MSVLAGLGAFAGGVAKGAVFGEKINAMKDERKARAAQQKAMDAFFKTLEEKNATKPGLANFTNTNDLSIPTAIDYTSGAGVMSDQPEQQAQNPAIGTTYPDYTPQKFADGGMVQDPNAFVNQVQQPTQQQASPMQSVGLDSLAKKQAAPTQQKPRKNPFQIASDLKDAYYEAAKVAHAEGGNDLAMKFMTLGFEQEDKLYKHEKNKALNAFDLTGDVNALVPLYNDQVPDGHTITSASQTPDGKYKFSIQAPNGKQIEQTYSKDDILGMVSSIDDPATRFALRAKSLLERQNKLFDAELDVQKHKEIEANKVHTVGLDSVLMDGKGNKLYDGSANRPKFKNEQDVYAAANDPADPRSQLAKSIIRQQREEKISTATASRAPREIPLEKLAYADWQKKPENSGKGISDFLKDKASWGKDIGLDTVTTSTSTIDPVTGAETSKETRSTKVPRGQEPTKPAAKKDFNLDKYLH